MSNNEQLEFEEMINEIVSQIEPYIRFVISNAMASKSGGAMIAKKPWGQPVFVSSIRETTESAKAEIFVQKKPPDEDGGALLAAAISILDKRWSGTFKAADVASLINETNNSPDSLVIREFLFPGHRSDVVSAKSVGKRLVAQVGKPIRLDGKTLSLCVHMDSHSKMKSFFVRLKPATQQAQAAE